MRTILIVLLVWSSCLPAIGQVNLQTGSATLNLSMFNWQDDKSRLTNGIALQYNSAFGLRVDEVASNVGQGWGLAGGGVINRIQVGEPDDQKPRDGSYNDETKYPAGYLYNPISASQGCPQEMVRYPLFGSGNQLYKQHNELNADREPDRFTFEFNGQSGTFVLGKNNNDQGILIGDSKMKIWFSRDEGLANAENSRTTISAFYILDENGLKYTFSQRGRTKVLKVRSNTTTYLDGGVYEETANDEIPLSSNPYITTSWYLTQIKDSLTGRTIDFTYLVRNLNNQDGVDMRSCSATQTVPDYVILTYKRSITVTPVISGIKYPDGHNVNFKYDESLSRFDLKGDYPLKSIDVTYNGRAVNSYLFNTAYFILNRIGMPVNATESKQARLCLRSVTKVGIDLKENENPYVFDYYTGTGINGDFVPPPYYYFQDIWGYYNGGKNNDLLNQSTTGTIPFSVDRLRDLGFKKLRALCFIKDDGSTSYYANVDLGTPTNPGMPKNGLLKSIKSPLGGVTTYEYEQNRLEKYTIDMQVLEYGAGVHVSKVSQTNGGASFDGTSSVTTSYVYKKADGTTSFWGGNALPTNRLMATYLYEPAGSHYVLSSGGCKYDYTFPGILSREESHSIPSQNISFMQVFSQVLTVVNLAIDVVSLVASGNPGPLIMDVVSIVVQIVTGCSNSYQTEGQNYMVLNRDAFAKNSMPYQFSRVEVIVGDASNNLGKTEYEFTCLDDYPLWVNDFFVPASEYGYAFDAFSMKQLGASWAYGLPKKVIVKDVNNKKVKETENIYDWSNPNIKRLASADMSCHCLIDRSVSMKGPDWINLSNSQNIHYTTNSITYNPAYETWETRYQLKVDQYQMYTGRVELLDSYERSFKQGDDTRYTEAHKHYEYNPNNYQVKRISTTQSNGEKLIKELYYPGDYNAGGVLKTLTDNNIIDVPVATYSSIENTSGVSRYVGAVVNDYNTVPGGDIKLSRTLANQSAAPAYGYSFDVANPYNFPGLVEVGSFQYDSKGKLSGIKDDGAHMVANIYDYDDKCVVASIVNASPLTDRYAYTSFETQSMGGWSLAGNANYVNASVTGDRSLALSNGLLSAALDQGRNYRLTFWATGSVTISGSGATLITSGPVNNGFTYYEYKITATGSSITVSGNVNIDELRLYPEMARMRTVAFDPLIGKTAECDESNRITYYDYDNLGRLRFVRDEKRNIIKMYEYNFKK